MRLFNTLAALVLLAVWSVSASAGPIYAIKDDGDMLFYKHTGTDDGSASWPIMAKKIGNGWNFKQVLARDRGAIYAIKDNGNMLFYRKAGMDDGSAGGPIRRRKSGTAGTSSRSLPAIM